MNITDADREAMVQTIMDRAIGCCSPSQQDAEELLYDLTSAITRIEEDARLRGYNAGLEAAAAYVQANYPHDKRALVPGIRTIDPATVGEAK